MKYNKIEEIKQTKRYKELHSAYVNNPTKYTMFDLYDYCFEEMQQSKEFCEKWDDWNNHFINQLVDVKDLALGDKDVFVV